MNIHEEFQTAMDIEKVKKITEHYYHLFIIPILIFLYSRIFSIVSMHMTDILRTEMCFKRPMIN